MQRIKRVRRSATAEGNLLEMKTPKFITLVGKPANQRAFSAVRSDGTDGKPARHRRVRRSDSSNLAKIQFPADMTEAQVGEALAGYGLTEFEVKRADESSPWVASNSAIVCTDADLVSHKLTESGITAYVKRSAAPEAVSGKNKLVVSSISFQGEDVQRSDVESWLDENGVDYDEKALNNSSGTFVLQRAELEEGAETRQVELAEGVVATITRSDQQDIPDGFVLVINETAYSGYGWGQLDFNATMADRTVGEQIEEAQCVLNRTLDNILYWNSDLTVDAKKMLISRTCDQFAAYVNSFLDQLPRQLLVPVTTSTTVQRSDEPKESAEMSKENAQAAGLSKEDVAGIVRDVIRSEREAEAAAATAAAAQAAAEAQAAEVRRSEITEVVADVLKPIQETLAKLSNTTVLRSDDTDADGKPREREVQRSGGLFTGILGNIGTLRDVSEQAGEEDGE